MKLRNVFPFLLITLITSTFPAIAQTTWTVDQGGGGDFLTIQEGIDAAADGDTVLVADGIYTGIGNKNLDFGGKPITVKSRNGPEYCIVDGEGEGTGFYFHTSEGPSSLLEGLTIRNFNASGIRIAQSDPTISKCTIIGNTTNLRGGGIEINGHPSWHASPLIKDCIIRNNSAMHGGGGLLVYECSPTIVNCDISFNYAERYGGAGMTLYTGSPVILNCSIIGNTANADICGDPLLCHAGGVLVDMYWGGVGPNISNSIVWGNTPENVVFCRGEALFTYSDVEGGWPGEGNIDADPLFVPGPDGDHYLSQTAAGQPQESPCVDAGDPSTQLWGWSSRTTRTDQHLDTGPVDMGYHYLSDHSPGGDTDCLYFNGTDTYVEIPDTPELSGGPGKSLTVEARFFLAELPPDWMAIVQKYWNYNNKDWGLYMDHTGLVGFQKETWSMEGCQSGNWQIYSSEPLLVNEWTHVAFVFDNDQDVVNLYLNGILTGSRALVDCDLPDTDAVVSIGASGPFYRSAGDPIKLFHGYFSEVRIWNVARTEGEILANMLPGSVTGNKQGLVAFYDFLQGDNPAILYDRTVNPNNGSISNPACGPRMRMRMGIQVLLAGETTATTLMRT